MQLPPSRPPSRHPLHFQRLDTHRSIERLDLILEAEGDTPTRYRLSEQADVLMLIYLLGPPELIHVLSTR